MPDRALRAGDPREGREGGGSYVSCQTVPAGGWGNQTNQARRGTWRLRASTDGLGLLGVVGRARMLVAVSVP